MKTNSKYNIHPQFIIRTPLNPMNELDKFEQEYNQMSTKTEDSLFLASPNLLAQLKKQIKNSEEEKIKRSFYKYWSRSHTRCTPFGLFAGCQIGKWGDTTKMEIPTAEVIKRHTCLDMNYLCSLVKHIEQHPDVRFQLTYYPNSSLHYFHNKARYIYYTYDKQNNRKHQLTSVELDEYNRKILKDTKTGKTLAQLINNLIDDEINKDEATGYLLELTEAQLLISELDVAIAGDEFILQIIQTLSSLKEQTIYITQTITLLQAINDALKKLDINRFNRKEDYDKIIAQIHAFDHPFDVSKLFQTNTYKTSSSISQLEHSLKKEIIEAVHFLNQLLPFQDDKQLTKFAQKFYERYEDRKINILDVLDVESGIGFPVNAKSAINNPIVENIDSLQTNNTDSVFSWNKHERFLLQLAQHALKQNLHEINLKSYKPYQDTEEYKAPFPPSVSFTGSLVGYDKNQMPQFHLQYCGGSSAINLLSRFAHGNSSIEALIKDIVCKEQEKTQDKILAEIIHLPQARTGNIIKHPTFLEHEICYLAKPSVASDKVLELEDLEISVSPNDNHIRIWSKKHQKEVIPRLSNAHNFEAASLPIYHFLSAMQYHKHSKGVMFSWSHIATKFSFLPRIRFGNTILRRAIWNIKKEDLKTSLDALKNRTDVLPYFLAFCKKHKLPKQFILVEGDNELLIDTDKRLSVETFLDHVKKKEKLQLTEFLFSAFTPITKDKNNAPYTNEIIGTILNEQYKSLTVPYQSTTYKIKQTFPPGSKWVYFKIYCGEKTSDIVLTEFIKPFIEQYQNEAYFDKWFFIRYKDPDNHIRFRILLNNLNYVGTLQVEFIKLLNPLIEKGLIHNVSLDTYKREVERYGEETMELSESWFCAESKNTIDFLSRIEGDIGEEFKWQYCISSIDNLLTSFDYSLEQRKELLFLLYQNFGKEFGLNKTLKKQLDKKYRDKKNIITSILNNEIISEEYQEYYSILNTKNKAVANTAKKILGFYEVGKSPSPLHRLLSSYIHMLCNRIFNGNPRFHEMVIYALLYRYYNIKLGQLKHHRKLSRSEKV